MGKEMVTCSGSREDLDTENKLKEKYTKTHIIQTEKIKFKEKILKSAMENNTLYARESP